MENMQKTGCFKIRGATYQISRLQSQMSVSQRLITWSGGNYGKAFATVCRELGLPCTVLMPNTVPTDRIGLLRSLGADVEVHEYGKINTLMETYVRDRKMLALHPFDDVDLIKGYGSIALEILESVPDPDVVLVPCGGGGLLVGVAAALRQSGCRETRVFGVEAETAATMAEGLKAGCPVTLPDARSVATGLVPLRTGDITLALCQKHVDSILTVSDEEILEAVRSLFDLGLVVEPSGAAGFAALEAGKLPLDLTNKKVVVVVSGRNVTLESLVSLLGPR